MLSLWLTRHGETDFNVAGRYAGATDVLLNAVGIKQAAGLLENPLVYQADIIVSSPLLRALQTALIIQKNTGKALHVVPEFAERNLGVFEGLTQEEAQQKYPELWVRQCTRLVDDAPTKGETIREVAARVQRGLEYLRQNYEDRKVLLVAHGFVAREINRNLNGLSFEEMHNFSLANCALVTYKIL